MWSYVRKNDKNDKSQKCNVSLHLFAVFTLGIQQEWHLEPKEVVVYICYANTYLKIKLDQIHVKELNWSNACLKIKLVQIHVKN